jgi:O-antigen/teichoic acid export membrane protein
MRSARALSIAGLSPSFRRHFPILRDIAATSSVRVYSTLLSMVALMLTARWLGPHGRGVGVVVTTWVTLLSSIGYLSLGQVCVHRAANEPDQQWIGPTLAALGMVAAMATLAGWALALLIYLFGSRLFAGIPAGALALGFAALPFFIWEQYGSALLTIVGKLRLYNLNQLIGRTLGLVVLVVTIKLMGLGIYGFLLAFVVGQAVVSSAGAAVLLKHARGRLHGGLAVVGALVKDGLKLHLNAIGVLLFTGVDILMLQYFRGATEAGLFQLPMQLFLAMLLVPQAAQLALQARVASRTRADFWREHRVIIAYVVGAMTIVAAALWMLAPWVVTLLASDRFEASVPVFRILMLGVPGACFNTLMGIQWITRGYFFRVSIVTLLTGLLNCGMNLLLIPSFGAHGAAVAAVIGMCMIPLFANLWLAWIAEREIVRSDG